VHGIALRAAALRLQPGGELVVAGLASAVLGLVVFLPYVRAGGYHLDDWSNGSAFHFHGFTGLFNSTLYATPRTPLYAVFLASVYQLLAEHEHWHLALSAGLHLVVGLLLFRLLRQLSMPRVSAAACVALALLFPYADSLWLWANACQMDTAVGLWLLGATLAVRGLASSDRGRTWHGGALVLYAASVLLYDATLIAVALTGALYLLRAQRRLALRRWAADVGVVVACFVLFGSQLVDLTGGVDVHVVIGLRATLDHALLIAGQGLTIATQALVPFGSPGRTPVSLTVLALVLGAVLVARRTTDAVLRRELVRSLVTVVAGTLSTIAGWGMLAPADPAYYSPLAPALSNRVNLIADIGLPVVAVGLLGLVAALIFSGVPRDRRWAGPLLVLVGTTAIAGAYLHHIDADRAAWIASRRMQGVVLDRLHALLGPPPAGSTVVVRGFALYTGPDVPVFNASWDLNGAVQLLWNDGTLRAWPGPPGSLACAATGMTVTGFGELGPLAQYGHVFVADVSSGVASRVDSLRQCRALPS
jgi:hypothetical protein